MIEEIELRYPSNTRYQCIESIIETDCQRMLTECPANAQRILRSDSQQIRIDLHALEAF